MTSHYALVVGFITAVAREFRDVVFEDVVLDNNIFYPILYLDVT